MGPRAETDVRIRSTRESDLSDIMELLRVSLGEGTIPRTAAYWRWKHLESPFGPSPVIVAERNGDIVGLRAFQRWRLWRNGKPLNAVRAVDTATHPDWRGQGIFTRLTLALVEREAENGTALVFNTPNRKSRPGYLKMGWSVVGRLTPWVRLRRPVRTALSLWRRYARESALSREQEDVPRDSRDRNVRELLQHPRFPDLLSHPSDSTDGISLRLTREYLSWRYSHVPGFTYRAAWNLTRSDGAAIVFRSKEGRPRELRICELFIRPTGAIRGAIDLLRETVSETAADVVTVMPTSHRERRVLLQAGFIPLPRIGPLLTVRPLNGTAAATDAQRRSHWQLSAGALELF